MVGADIWRVVRSASLKCFCEHVRNWADPPRLEMRHFLAAIDEAKAGLSVRGKEMVAPLPIQIE
jgi:hypothetical protein